MQSFLIIDDEYLTRLIHEMLIKSEFPAAAIYTCSSGAEALEFLEECKRGVRPYPTVILLDINMPVMNGFEFLAQYEELFGSIAHARICIVTSSYHAFDKTKAEQFKVDYYKVKPLNESDIRDLISP